MKFAQRILLAGGLAVLVTVIGNSSARAQLTGYTTGASPTVTLDATSGTGGSLATIQSLSNEDAVYTTYISNNGGVTYGQYASYCVDLVHYTTSAKPLTLPTQGLNWTPGYTDVQAVSSSSFAQAAYIANNYQTLLGVSGALTSEQHAAVQDAIWATEYGGATSSIGLTYSLGTLTDTSGIGASKRTITLSSGGQSLTDANSILTAWFALGAPTASATWVEYGPPGSQTAQYQLIPSSTIIIQSAVPEPSTMAIAGLGALGFIGYSLRRRKSA